MSDKKVLRFRSINIEVKNTLKNIGLKLRQRYKFVLKRLLIIFLWLFIAFWSSVVVQLVQDWKEFKSPYPIMLEYYRILYFGSYRSWMIEYGSSENNLLFKWLERQQKKDLEYIKSLIPKDDLLIDLLEWQIKFEPYFMHTFYDTHSKIYGLIEWLISIRFKKSHIKQIEDQFKFIDFGYGMEIGMINGGCNGIDSLNICEKFAKSILLTIKKDNYFAQTVMQSLFVSITLTKIAMSHKAWGVYTEKTCTNPYYPILIKQIHEWRGYIERLSGLTARERRVIKTYIKIYNSEAKEIYEFNNKYCLKK
jgi:hypothetical protein